MQHTLDDERVMTEVSKWFDQHRHLFKLNECYGIDICADLYNLVKTCIQKDEGKS